MSASKNKASSLITGLLFVLAIGLLLFSTIGSARAALNVQSDILVSDFGMLDIGIGLTDGKSAVSGSVLLKGMLGSDSKLLPGKLYTNKIYVSNSGNIKEYTRVTVYKYWEKQDPTTKEWVKDNTLKTSYIDLGIAGGWKSDGSMPSTYGERTMYYYTGRPLSIGEQVPFLNSVNISDNILKYVSQSTSGNVITTTYLYDGARFCIEIEADGVQTHNAKDAILSAWGKNVKVTDDGPITGGIG